MRVAIPAVSHEGYFGLLNLSSRAHLAATHYQNIRRHSPAISNPLCHPTFISEPGYKSTSALFHHCIIDYNLLLLLTPLLALRAQHQGPSSYTSFHPTNASTVFDQIPTSSNRVPCKKVFPHHGGEVLSLPASFYFSTSRAAISSLTHDDHGIRCWPRTRLLCSRLGQHHPRQRFGL